MIINSLYQARGSFDPAPGGGGGVTTWDTGVSTLALSNGNLTATNAGGGGFAISSNTKSSGKWYWELTFGGGSPGDNLFLPSTWYTAVLDTAGVSFPTGWNYGQGDVWHVNGSTFNYALHPLSGVIGATAADFTNKKIWWRLDTNLDWNNDPSADPATGTGGIDFTAGTVGGTFWLAVNLGDTAGASATLNVGGSAFTMSVPSGFTAWG